MNNKRVFILGLDGATFDIINPMIAEGELPNLKALMEKGSYGPLNSTLLHHSPPAWTSFATGRNPGKHGVLGFTRMADSSYNLELVNGKDNKASTMWGELGEDGKKVIVMNIPMTYPPKAVNGLLISGLDTPSTDVDFTYPKSLKQEILKVVPNYKINLHLGGYLYNDKRKLMGLKLIHDNIESQRKTVLHLMEKHPWDLFAVRFNSPDNVQHQYWAYMDESHPEHNAKADPRLKTAIWDVYRRLDQVVGEVSRRLDAEESTLIIMSDHGAGARLGKSIFVNEWLHDIGLLGRIGGEKKNGLRRCMDDMWFLAKGKILSFLLKTIPPNLKAKLTELIPWAASKTAGYLRFSGLDWAKTKAFIGEVEGIRINLKGKYPQGTVSREAYENVREEIISKAKLLKDPETGKGVFKGVYRREEVFQGPCTGNMPDIILKPQDQYYISPKFFRNQKRVDGFLAHDTHWRKISGSHRQYGILVMTGPHIKENESVQGAEIVDIFATTSYVLGMPIPSDLDGNVLFQTLKDDYVASHKVQTKESEGGGPHDGDSHVYSEDEEKELLESLKGLGYIG